MKQCTRNRVSTRGSLAHFSVGQLPACVRTVSKPYPFWLLRLAFERKADAEFRSLRATRIFRITQPRKLTPTARAKDAIPVIGSRVSLRAGSSSIARFSVLNASGACLRYTRAA